MGHLRLGRLPKYPRWQEVVGLLDTTPGDTAIIAKATILASEDHLRSLSKDPSLTYTFWLLCRITSASRSADFGARLADLSIPAKLGQPTIAFIASVSDHMRDRLSHYPESGPSSELASLALRRALTETVGTEGRSLFGNTVQDLQHAFREHSSPNRFGRVAQRFFGDFLARTLRSYLDREVANHIGLSQSLDSIPASNEFLTAVDVHSRQSARIVEDFAGSWFSKHDYESHGEIGQEEASRFVAVALRKLRSELKREAE